MGRGDLETVRNQELADKVRKGWKMGQVVQKKLWKIYTITQFIIKNNK